MKTERRALNDNREKNVSSFWPLCTPMMLYRTGQIADGAADKGPDLMATFSGLTYVDDDRLSFKW